jgi:hypothetical protein
LAKAVENPVIVPNIHIIYIYAQSPAPFKGAGEGRSGILKLRKNQEFANT